MVNDRSQTETVARDGCNVGGDVTSEESVRLATPSWLWKEKGDRPHNKRGKMIPESPAREQAGGRNSDIRRACQNRR